MQSQVSKEVGYSRQPHESFRAHSTNKYSAEKLQDLSPDGEIDCSIVIALYNEEQVIGRLVEKLASVMQRNKEKKFEVILVNDGSSDNTLKELQSFSQIQSFNVVDLVTNCGQVQALSCGISICRGKYTIVTDGDLQFDLDDIDRFFEAVVRRPVEIVTSYRVSRKDSLFRKGFSATFSRLLRLLFGFKFSEPGSNFRLLSRNLLERCRASDDRILFNIMQFSEYSKSWSEIEVKTAQREHGVSSWSFKSLFLFYADLITYSSYFPLFLITVSTITFISGLVLGIFNIFNSHVDSLYITAPTSIVISSATIMFLGVIFLLIQSLFKRVLGVGSWQIRFIHNAKNK